MTASNRFEIFLATAPGLETALATEARALGFARPKPIAGGVTFSGRWPEVWRANLASRGASRVLARIDAFRAIHLSQLDKRARRVPWKTVLRANVPVRVETTCKASRIYHSGAATERIERAIREELGAPISDDATVVIKARIERDICTVAIDTSGESLHKRGFKEEVAKAPMRENLAALFLRECGYDGSETVLDPMCGSGTFVIEAAEIAAGLMPGRARHFAFEELATFDAAAWQKMRSVSSETKPDVRFHGSDRDGGAIRMSRANAERAGITALTEFTLTPIEELTAPAGPPGLVIVNPPYGDRIGDRKRLFTLYRALGQTLLTRFAGWRVGLITSDPQLAKATGLPFTPPSPPVLHGGLRITLFRTDRLT
ncbi:MAG: class I SAM-dependent RNA methyltransferase [Hyphomicrobiaceae bacterium]